MSKGIIVKYNGLEILCNPGTVVSYRSGKSKLSDVLLTDDAIYKSVKSGNVASENDLIKAFGEKVELKDGFDIMLQKGDFQMTTKERQELNQQRRAKLVEYFHHNYLNPDTNTPIPVVRIEAAFKTIKARVNYEISFNKNCEEIRKGLIGVLPIKPKDNSIINLFQSNDNNQKSNTDKGYKGDKGNKGYKKNKGHKGK